jgi:hypothetical protein
MVELSMQRTTIITVLLLSLTANLALAAGDNDQGQNNQSQSREWHDHNPGRDQRFVSAPEINPGQAVAALVLVSGAVAIIRGFRRKK